MILEKARGWDMKKQIIGFAILLFLLLLSGEAQPAAARGCSGGLYEGHPALARECEHQQTVWEHSGDGYTCMQWNGTRVCYNGVQACYDGECYYKGNVEDYCREYGNCTPPWLTQNPYPGPVDTTPEPYPGPGDQVHPTETYFYPPSGTINPCEHPPYGCETPEP